MLASQSPSGPTRGEENRHGAKHILTTPAKVSWKVDLQQLKVDEVLPQDKDCIQSYPYQLRVREANGTWRRNLGVDKGARMAREFDR
jgi:hypothetical protein